MRTYHDLTERELDDLAAWVREPGCIGYVAMGEHLSVKHSTLRSWVLNIARDRGIDLTAWRTAMQSRAPHGARPAVVSPRREYRDMTPEQQQALREAILHPEGQTMTRVAERAGCKPSTVRGWVHRYAQLHQLDPEPWEKWIAQNYDQSKRGQPSRAYQRMLSRTDTQPRMATNSEHMLQRIRDPLCDYLEHEHITTAAFCVAQSVTRKSLEDVLLHLHRSGEMDVMRQDWRDRVDACIEQLRAAHEEQHASVCAEHRLARAAVYRRWVRVEPGKILPDLDYGDVLWALRDSLTPEDIRRWRRAMEQHWGWEPGTYRRAGT